MRAPLPPEQREVAVSASSIPLPCGQQVPAWEGVQPSGSCRTSDESQSSSLSTLLSSASQQRGVAGEAAGREGGCGGEGRRAPPLPAPAPVPAAWKRQHIEARGPPASGPGMLMRASAFPQPGHCAARPTCSSGAPIVPAPIHRQFSVRQWAGAFVRPAPSLAAECGTAAAPGPQAPARRPCLYRGRVRASLGRASSAPCRLAASPLPAPGMAPSTVAVELLSPKEKN